MSIKELSNRFEDKLDIVSSKHGLKLIQWSIGIIYLWFGALKFFSGLSPAEKLAGDTLSVLVFHSVDEQILLWGLAIAEVAIGIGMLFRLKPKLLLYAVFVHMAGTLLPLLFFPDTVFNQPPFGFSIVGQYIMKNLVIISVIIMIYSKNQKSH